LAILLLHQQINTTGAVDQHQYLELLEYVCDRIVIVAICVIINKYRLILCHRLSQRNIAVPTGLIIKNIYQSILADPAALWR